MKSYFQYYSSLSLQMIITIISWKYFIIYKLSFSWNTVRNLYCQWLESKSIYLALYGLLQTFDSAKGYCITAILQTAEIKAWKVFCLIPWNSSNLGPDLQLTGRSGFKTSRHVETSICQTININVVIVTVCNDPFWTIKCQF